MAGYRYWQINFLHSADADFNQLAYFEMRESVGGANLATNSAQATMTAVGSAGSGVIADLFVDSSSVVVWQQLNNVTITYDFGLGGDREILEVVLRGGPANLSRNPRLIAVRRSDDGVTWHVAWVILYDGWTADEKKVFSRPFLPEAARYWAMVGIDIEASTKFLQVSEIVMREIPGDPTITTGGSPFMTNEDAGQPASNAFDGSTATYASNDSTSYRDMIGYDFGAANEQVVRVFEATSRSTVSFNRMPSLGCIVKSNNFQDWEVMSNFSGISWSSAETETLYEAPFLVKDVTIVYGFVPLPAELLQFIPDGGIRETWDWLTVISTTYSGREQRMARRDTPRYSYQFTKTITDDDDRREAYNLIRDSLGSTIMLPMFHQMAALTAPSAMGTSEVYFDVSETDVRVGEYAALFNPFTETFLQVLVSSVDTFGVVLNDTLDQAVGEGWFIMPTIEASLPDGLGPSMTAILGSMSVNLSSMSKRGLTDSPGSPSLVSTFDGYPVLQYRPIAPRELGEEFDRNLEVIDNATGLPAIETDWDNSFFSGSREWLIEDPETFLWWRQFVELVRGRCRSFLLPTFRDDLPMIDTPVSPNQLITSNGRYVDYWTFETYKRIMIEASDGNHYRKVSAVTALGTNEILLTLDQDLPAGEIQKVGYLNLVRFNTDRFVWNHQRNYSVVSCGIRSIDE